MALRLPVLRRRIGLWPLRRGPDAGGLPSSGAIAIGGTLLSRAEGEGWRRDVEDFDVCGELYLVPLADEQETDPVFGQRLVYAGGDVFVAAAVGLGVPPELADGPGAGTLRMGWSGESSGPALVRIRGKSRVSRRISISSVASRAAPDSRLPETKAWLRRWPA